MALVGIRAGLSVDHLVTVGESPAYSVLGGPGLYGGLGARLVLGTDVRLATTLPSDEPRFARLFDELGVDTRFSNSATTAARYWILNSAEGRRIVATRAPSDSEIESIVESHEHDVPPESAPFSSGLDGALTSNPESPIDFGDAVVGVDPHQALLASRGLDYLREHATSRGVLLPSRVHLRMVHADPLQAAHVMSHRLGCPVVARLDADGMYAVDTDGSSWRLQDPAAVVADTTGAGDSSAGAIVAALAGGADLVEAAGFGLSVARLAISGTGHAGLVAPPLTSPFPTLLIRKVGHRV